MSLMTAPTGFTRLESAQATLTAHATPHSEGSYTTLIASTAYDTYGLSIDLCGMSVAATATSGRVDIAIGAAASETNIITDLLAGYTRTLVTSGALGHGYYFPIFIPEGTRISARLQALITADTCDVTITAFQKPSGPVWAGGSVTTIGAAANSLGTAVTAGTTGSYASPTYGTGVSLGTGGPFKYLQIGMQGNASTALNDMQGLVEIRDVTTPMVSRLQIGSGVSEQVGFREANLQLSKMVFNLPASTDLRIAAWASAAFAGDFIIYGVN